MHGGKKKNKRRLKMTLSEILKINEGRMRINVQATDENKPINREKNRKRGEEARDNKHRPNCPPVNN